ncbi:MAG: hypothetical protein CVT64_05190 [Actinobacteria bacterium HGW-Actinobacteria-4]|nr:MAG: hypothetical protein CVT64_05190 [Actinobacteria bacterium HGW-Actinobacteria-4]
MGVYSGLVYPAVLTVLGALAAGGLVTLVWVRAHTALKWIVTATYIVTVVQLIAAAVVLFGGIEVSLVTTVGYMLTSLILLPLMGIGRLGEPEAAALDPDPNRPVLAPDQVARVDAVAALIVAIALAVVAWRLEILLAAGT